MPAEFDAVFLPHAAKVGASSLDRIANAQSRFGPILGGKVFARDIPSLGGSLLTADLTHAYYFPVSHRRAGEERFDWARVDDDGVKYGRLKDDDV